MHRAAATQPDARTAERAAIRSRIMIFAMAAPLLAQCIMVVAMLTQGQWLFAVMIIPGTVGCLASLLVAVPWPSAASNHTAASMPQDRGISDYATTDVIDGSLAGKPAENIRFDAPASPCLEELMGFGRLPWRTIVARWLAQPDFAVPIGMSATGPLLIDLQRQGPHALVAGTTGSGKSVLLQSWCLALAAMNGPDRLNFVFLDFKGGSAFRPLEALPHTVGSVCDLDLTHAARALRALEAELTRRERLVAESRSHQLDDLTAPPPRLVVVIDEFHALKDQLPDYIGRLVRIASLGRSLGMHLIACTQNPAGQVSADMKANMAISICLRVRDAMQSIELLSDGRAAALSPAMPGAAYCNDCATVSALRCAATDDIDACCQQIALAARFMAMTPSPPLFTAPLPTQVEVTKQSPNCNRLWFGLADDGIGLASATVPVFSGNIGIIGPLGRGKTTVLQTIAQQACCIPATDVRCSILMRDGWQTTRRHNNPMPVSATQAAPPHVPRTLWLVDDADSLFDPFNTDPFASTFRQALADPTTSVVFAVASCRHVRVPEHCVTRIVFPCGDRSADLLAGIPAPLLACLSRNDLNTPGRGVLIDGANALLVQCAQ
ncbi:DNA segregation ATPase and related proteins (FtsK/SpoIIIE family) [Bifidobacterium sp. DSM 109957]|uniref:DNA segregation ATPase and related proteins (FtsK/SpoIIIE family) n=2 Tax=Bifidobacterium oedipodis TaxID=2675322 RepID=A0A7Y0ENQ8_9BIFI|nr:DNA segregation ATPase and related proteins (FtsK/SpoIIIE family) [Bifidobacterium sp. DSM 109957]